MPFWKKCLIWGIVIWVVIGAPALVAALITGGFHVIGELVASISGIAKSVGPAPKP